MAKVSPRRAYSASLADATRQVPTEEELCHFTWALRFNAVSWFIGALGALTVRRYYHPNHTITAPPGDPLWGDLEPQRHYWYFRPGPDGSPVLQVNTYPFLTCSRTADWGWELQNSMVHLTIDVAAGPNPGPPASHPASGDTLSPAQVEARFNMLLRLEEMDEQGGEEEEEEESEVEEAHERELGRTEASSEAQRG